MATSQCTSHFHVNRQASKEEPLALILFHMKHWTIVLKGLHSYTMIRCIFELLSSKQHLQSEAAVGLIGHKVPTRLSLLQFTPHSAYHHEYTVQIFLVEITFCSFCKFHSLLHILHITKYYFCYIIILISLHCTNIFEHWNEPATKVLGIGRRHAGSWCMVASHSCGEMLLHHAWLRDKIWEWNEAKRTNGHTQYLQQAEYPFTHRS